MTSPRGAPAVLVGYFSVESNSFVDAETTLDDFRRQTFAVGAELHREVLGPASELTGAWDVLDEAGCRIVPSVAAGSSPAPPVSDEVVETVLAHLLHACSDELSGVYLALHGSAVSRSHDDPEGLLLGALRERLGAGVPIAISLDHHANLTTRMLDAVDIVTAYRTCPHTDLKECGAQAAALLVRAIRGEIHPVCAMAGRPMITSAERFDSSQGPYRTIMESCDREEQAGALAAAMLPVQPWLDVPELGWKAVVTTDGDRAAASAAAERMMAIAWALRADFLTGQRSAPDDAIREALCGPLPCVIADAGDATNAGTLGDSTELLRSARRVAGGFRVLLCIRDAHAAAIAHDAGVGETVALTLGRGDAGEYNEAVRFEGVVQSVFDGELRYTHPAALGMRASTGRAARVRSDDIDVVVHSEIVRLIDPVVYEALAADLTDVAIVQAKSHVSYRAGFERISSRSIVADTLGPSAADLRLLPYTRRPRPLFPFELVDELPGEAPFAPSPTREIGSPDMTGNESSPLRTGRS
jgi:microcystin degradation protein MlrC